MLVKSLALELAPDIRVNGIAPGAILWPGDDESDNSESLQAKLRRIPLQRTGGTESITSTVLFIIENFLDLLNSHECLHVLGKSFF